MRTKQSREAWYNDPANFPSDKQIEEDIRLGKRDSAGNRIKKLPDGRTAIELPGGGWVVPVCGIGSYEETK